MALTGKRLLLIGFIIVLLIGIPATLFLVQQQQELRSRAQASTNLYYQPESSQAAPLQKNLGDTFSLDLYANPGVNLVSTVRIEISYDPTKLSTASATPGQSAFVTNPDNLSSIIFGPVYTPGKVLVTVSAGSDPTKYIDAISKIGSISFTAVGGTAGQVTQISYGTSTLVTSSAGESDANPLGDQFAENVLSGTTPAFITIAGDATQPTVTPPTATPTKTSGPTPTAEDEPTATPTTSDNPDEPTPEFTEAPTATPIASDSPTLTPTLSADYTQTPTPTLEPTGPGETIIGFGIVAAIMTILGGILFFAL
jgi:hypothetical protein